ncbi:MAG: hypothetical protein LBH70_02860 [Spirochaetaceae bacterium]|jgi:hypothetical protein|nr:hypothetical protein [Spirochaetaceae bacterium]
MSEFRFTGGRPADFQDMLVFLTCVRRVRVYRVDITARNGNTYPALAKISPMLREEPGFTAPGTGALGNAFAGSLARLWIFAPPGPQKSRLSGLLWHAGWKRV